MKIINGLLDYTQKWNLPDLYLFTGNPIINARGGIVMRRGAAKQVRDYYPNIDIKFAKAPGESIKWVMITPTQLIGWIKVKHHWAEDANLDLILYSFSKLNELAKENPKFRFHCNYPGIGNGKLSYNKVDNILKSINIIDSIILYK